MTEPMYTDPKLNKRCKIMPTNPDLNIKILENIPKISSIYQTINTNINHYVDHIIFNKTRPIDEKTISIVMTTHDRIPQTLFTLDTINGSSYKNIQVIIVDDSGIKFIDNDKLSVYPFRIDYLKIDDNNKDWINPCVNYNIGFKYIKGRYLIIQNAETCHVGDIIKYVSNNSNAGTYLVFDVINTGSYNNNERLYLTCPQRLPDYDRITELAKLNSFVWYQHYNHKPAKYHFLTAMHMDDFKNLGDGFDYDFALSRGTDDVEFVFRIMYILKLDIIEVKSDATELMGVHQYHDVARPKNATNDKSYIRESRLVNRYVYSKKYSYFLRTREWLFLYKSSENLQSFKEIYTDIHKIISY